MLITSPQLKQQRLSTAHMLDWPYGWPPKRRNDDGNIVKSQRGFLRMDDIGLGKAKPTLAGFSLSGL
jgi:hypothetical protein